MLLFAHHHAVMDLYAKGAAAYHPVFITGREGLEKKQQSVEAFMRRRPIWCCISLRRPRTQPPAGHLRGVRRAGLVARGPFPGGGSGPPHRPADSLLCYYLVSPRGSDRDMQDALGLKVSQFVSLMGDAPVSPVESALRQVEARERIRRLVERLSEEE